MTRWRLDRVGGAASTGVVEDYPAGALALWGLPHKGYKAATSAKAQKARDEKRDVIMTELQGAAGGRLDVLRRGRIRLRR